MSSIRLNEYLPKNTLYIQEHIRWEQTNLYRWENYNKGTRLDLHLCNVSLDKLHVLNAFPCFIYMYNAMYTVSYVKQGV